MYILLLDGLFPKLVTCASEAAFAGDAPDMTATSSPAAVSVATQAANSALTHLFMLCLSLPWVLRIPSALAGANAERSRKFFGFLGFVSRLLHASVTSMARGARSQFA